MIVLARHPELLLVRQADHAASSREIAAAWCWPETLSSDLWERFLDGVAVHDDGWIDAELRPALNVDGRPRDFKETPVREHVDIWRRSVAMAREKDPVVGLVVALHAHALYQHHVEPSSREDRALATAFTDELARTIDVLKVELHDDGCLGILTDLIAFFDGISLMLLGAIPHMTETGALAMDGRRESLELAWTSDGVVVEPWPFSTPTVRTSLAAVRLQTQKFRGKKELERAVASAETTMLSWTLSPRR